VACADTPSNSPDAMLHNRLIVCLLFNHVPGTLQTATEAMSARSDDHTCPLIALEEVREHNNLNACNHRRPISSAHASAFPTVDFSGITVEGPKPEAEWVKPYKAAFGLLRERAGRALEAIDRRTEERVAVFCHATFMRAVLSNVLGVDDHHVAKAPHTGQAIEVWRIETPIGTRYWELASDMQHGHEVQRLAWRKVDGTAAAGERDDGAARASAPQNRGQ